MKLVGKLYTPTRNGHIRDNAMRLIFALCLFGIFSGHTLAAPFSIRCENAGYHFLTFDEQTSRVVLESPPQADGESPTELGKIKKAGEDEILLVIFVGGRWHPVDGVYRRSQGLVEFLGPQMSIVLANCVPNPLRAALSKYDQNWPLD